MRLLLKTYAYWIILTLLLIPLNVIFDSARFDMFFLMSIQGGKFILLSYYWKYSILAYFAIKYIFRSSDIKTQLPHFLLVWISSIFVACFGCIFIPHMFSEYDNSLSEYTNLYGIFSGYMVALIGLVYCLIVFLIILWHRKLNNL